MGFYRERCSQPMQSAIAITIFWQARVGLKRLVLAAIIILSLAFPSQADLYRYRDRNGRLVMSSTPPPAGVGTVTTVPENTGSSMATTVPSATYKNKKNRPSKPRYCSTVLWKLSKSLIHKELSRTLNLP